MKVNKEYKIDFFDHTQDSKKLMLCRVYGRIIAKNGDKITICPWDILEEDTETIEYNRLIFTLIRSAILKIEEI